MVKNNIPKSIALFDLDSTIYNTFTGIGFTKLAADKGLFDKFTCDYLMTELKKYKNKEENFKTAANNMLKIWADELKGKNYDDFYKMAQDFFTINKCNFYGYFIEVLPQLKKTHKVYLITTNAQFIAHAVVDMFNLDGFLSSEFEVVDNKFSGKIKSTFLEGKELYQI